MMIYTNVLLPNALEADSNERDNVFNLSVSFRGCGSVVDSVLVDGLLRLLFTHTSAHPFIHTRLYD
jgi:hypothetical protein